MKPILWMVVILVLAGCGESVDGNRSAPAADDRIARMEQRYRHGGPTTFAVTAWEIVMVADSLSGPRPAEAARLGRDVFLSSAPVEARFEALRILAVADPDQARHWLELVIQGRQDPDFLPRLRPLLPGDLPQGQDPLVVLAFRRFQQLYPLARISWLVGSWERSEGDLRVREEWFPAVGGVMHGISRTWREDDQVGWERLRIEADGEELVYTALPSGQAEAAFRGRPRLGVTIFSNSEHDFPEALQYVHDRPSGDLKVVAEGVVDGERRTLTWSYRRLHGSEAR